MPAPELKPDASERHLRLWAGGVLTFGIALRLSEFLHNDSLWGDEAMLALSIASRSFHGLLSPLGYGQVASVPFLWIERLMVTLFGVSEWSLRLPLLLGGCALLLLVTLVGRRILRSEEMLTALVLVAFSQTVIRYSAEVKPYALDALVTMTLIGVAAVHLRQGENTRSWGRLGGTGAVAIIVSLSSVFVCLGVGLALGLQALKTQKPKLLLLTALLGLGWAALFAFSYAQLYRAAANAPYMRSFWAGTFLTPGSPNLWVRTQIAVQEVLWGVDPGMALLGLGALTMALILLGTVTLVRRGQGPDAVLLLTPGVAPFAASAVGLYPIAARLMLFAVPPMIMLTAVGILRIAGFVHRIIDRLPIRWIVVPFVLPSVTSALAWTVIQGRDQQMRPLVHHLTTHWRPEDPVYVYHRIVPAWLFYTTDWTRPDTAQLAWAMRISGPGELGHENGPSRGPRSAGEGDALVYTLGSHRVSLGTSSGVQGRPMFGYRPRWPDSGWANSEGVRICKNARPRVWVVLGNSVHDGRDLGQVLVKGIKDAGGNSIYQYSLEDGKLLLYTCGPAGNH